MYLHTTAIGNRPSPASAIDSGRRQRRSPSFCVAVLAAALLAPCAPAVAAKLAFLTSTTGHGKFDDWAEAGGNTGLAAADAICVARATAANLPDPTSFVAWLSDSNNDAYCRMHGLTGKKIDNCGQASLPTGAGPWQRTDGLPFMGALDTIAQTGAVYTTLVKDEYGHDSDGHTTIYSGSHADGTADRYNCSNWTSAGGVEVNVGDTLHTFPGWSEWPGYSFCVTLEAHIACLQKGPGAPLSPLPHAHKRSFVTSQYYTGNLGAAPEAGGATGIAAGDAICRSLATTANLEDASSYKVYLGNGEGNPPSAHFQNDGPWERLDGVVFAQSFAQIHSGYVNAPLNETETGALVPAQFVYAWSGTGNDGGPAFQNCENWTMVGVDGWAAKLDAVGPAWPTPSTHSPSCASRNRLFCLSDADLIFRSNLE